ncbi:MAG: hydroxymethylglutaryl-CoA synthase [Halobacteriales archaeon]|jgi:hydroxymethylglutaryl-CoA synthase
MDTGKLLESDRTVGIHGYGAYVPKYRITNATIEEVWDGASTPIDRKAVAGSDEDSVTIAIEAAGYAVDRAGIDPGDLRAIWTGSKCPPYDVKPTSTIVADAIDAGPDIQASDVEFASKAGTEAVQSAIGAVGSGMAGYAMALGSDTAYGKPGDQTEYTAAAGGGAFVLGEAAEDAIATIEGSYSYATNTPDMWRRNDSKYPEHAHEFKDKPAFMDHVVTAAETLMDELGRTPNDYDYAVLDHPDRKRLGRAAAELGFEREQLEPGNLTDDIGHARSGATLIATAATLDRATPGDRILWVSFGSGAGSDAFSLEVEDGIETARERAPTVDAFVDRGVEIDYATYARFSGEIEA